MTKVEAPTLEEAYIKASKALECSISELQCEVVQHPNNGILGFFQKKAIIIATIQKEKKHQDKYLRVPSLEERVASEVLEDIKDNEGKIKDKPKVRPFKNEQIVDSFFEKSAENANETENTNENTEEESVSYDELALVIENELKELFSHSCFEIDVIEVDVHDNTALIFIDGNDAALLIGKEGYRYNALSYMLFNWLYTKYELFIKLEIAEFLTAQQEMIRNYIKPVIETAEKTGRAKTRFLDGMLAQIALEQLREHFPNKYVAVKTSKDGKKFVVINEFNTMKNG